MKIPKVLIVTTTYDKKDYCFEEFWDKASKIDYPNKRHIFIDNSKSLDYVETLQKRGLEVFHVERGNNSREALARSSNFGRKVCLEEGYDYMFMLESDVMVQPDIITKLMTHCKDVISGLYYIGNEDPRVPCITLPEYKNNIRAFGTRLLFMSEWADYFMNGLKQVAAGSFGCCLVHKNVLEDIKFYYDPRLKGHPDIYFFNTCFEKKIPVWVDTNIICQHKNISWNLVEDR